MKNLVSKTALKTVLAVVIALAVAFGGVSLGMPGQMAVLFERMGAYSFAAGYASLACTYDPSVENLSRCVNDNIFSADDKNVVNYGTRLMEHEEFESYYSGTPGTKQFIMGSIARSQYKLGDKTSALATAKKAMQGVGFPKNNALAALSLLAYDGQDGEFMALILAEVEGCTPQNDEETAYKASLIELLTLK